MDRHVGDQSGGVDIAGRRPSQQRPAEHRARQLDDVETGPRQRDADHLEPAAAGGKDEPRRPHAAAALALLGERFGELLLNAVVPRSARFASAALQGVPVAVASPRSAAAEAYRAAAVDLLARLYGRGKPSRRPVKAFLGSDVRAALCERS